MKILIVDKEPRSDFGRIGQRAKRAFEELGHTTDTFCYRPFQLHRFSFTRPIVDSMLLAKVKKSRPDMLFVTKGETLLPGTIRKISRMGIRTVNWCNDEPFGEFRRLNKVSNIGEYDHFLVFDRLYAKVLSKRYDNIGVLPPAGDTFFYKEQIPFNEREYPYDVGLLGSRYESRERILPKLLDYNLAITGPGWNNTLQELKPKVIKSRYYSIKDMISFFNSCRINLNIYYYHYKNPNVVEPHNSIPQHRTFELPSSKSFQICERLRDIDTFFKPGKEIVLYDDVNDLRKKIDYYLEHDKERIDIIEAAYKRIEKEHTYKHRMKQLLELISG